MLQSEVDRLNGRGQGKAITKLHGHPRAYPATPSGAAGGLGTGAELGPAGAVNGSSKCFQVGRWDGCIPLCATNFPLFTSLDSSSWLCWQNRVSSPRLKSTGKGGRGNNRGLGELSGETWRGNPVKTEPDWGPCVLTFVSRRCGWESDGTQVFSGGI